MIHVCVWASKQELEAAIEELEERADSCKALVSGALPVGHALCLVNLEINPAGLGTASPWWRPSSHSTWLPHRVLPHSFVAPSCFPPTECHGPILHRALAECSASGDYARLEELTNELAEVENELEEKSMRWLELAERADIS